MRRNGFESVLFSKYNGQCVEKFLSNGNTLMETSFLNRVTELEADTRHIAMVLRDLGLEK